MGACQDYLVSPHARSPHPPTVSIPPSPHVLPALESTQLTPFFLHLPLPFSHSTLSTFRPAPALPSSYLFPPSSYPSFFLAACPAFLPPILHSFLPCRLALISLHPVLPSSYLCGLPCFPSTLSCLPPTLPACPAFLQPCPAFLLSASL